MLIVPGLGLRVRGGSPGCRFRLFISSWICTRDELGVCKGFGFLVLRAAWREGLSLWRWCFASLMLKF